MILIMVNSIPRPGSTKRQKYWQWSIAYPSVQAVRYAATPVEVKSDADVVATGDGK
jgi:hypothetical protein